VQRFFFEIEGPSIGPVSSKGIVADLHKSFDEVMQLVNETAQSVHEGFRRIPNNARPNESEVCFGIKFNTDFGVVFAKIGAEGTFQITLRWKKEHEPV
jgi:hypothetical protein